ncbi:MAG: RNA polymerase sigma-70 factor (ECF subfamily) [Saprospiraceae bacterium]|jgi:RNA polymerase sigma-70 factor (ECF subfamily)
MTDQQLIENLQKGSEAAYQEVTRVYQERVMSVCLRYVKSQEDAKDLCQEVFIEVFRSIGDFRQEAKLSTWIHRIATTKSLEMIRYKERNKRACFFTAVGDLEEDRAMAMSDSAANPGQQLEQKERAKIIAENIERLSGQQRRAFVLHKMEGKSHKEISQIMDTSISAIESLLHRAKKKLQIYLQGYYQLGMI